MATFSKSKRFIEPKNEAPPPGAYDPRDLERTPTATLLSRIEAKEKENSPPVGAYDIGKENQHVPRSSRQELGSPTSPTSLNAKQKRLSSSASSLDRLEMPLSPTPSSMTPTPSSRTPSRKMRTSATATSFDTSMTSSASTSSAGFADHRVTSPIRNRKSPSSVASPSLSRASTSIANGHVNGHVNGGAGTPNNSSFQRSNGAGFGRTASLRGPSTMASKMAKMEKDFRAEIERLQNVIDVTNQIIEERQHELDSALESSEVKSEEIERLSRDLQEVTKEKVELELKLEFLTRENNNLNAHIHALKDDHVAALEEVRQKHLDDAEALCGKVRQEALQQKLKELEALEQEKEEEREALEEEWRQKMTKKLEEMKEKKEKEREDLLAKHAKEEEEEKRRNEEKLELKRRNHQLSLEDQREKNEENVRELEEEAEEKRREAEACFLEKIKEKEAEVEASAAEAWRQERQALRKAFEREKEVELGMMIGEKEAQRMEMEARKEREMMQVLAEAEVRAQREANEAEDQLKQEHGEMIANLTEEHSLRIKEMKACMNHEHEMRMAEMAEKYERRLREEEDGLRLQLGAEFDQQIQRQNDDLQQRLIGLESAVSSCREREARLMSAIEVMESDKKGLEAEVAQLRLKVEKKTREVENMMQQQQQQQQQQRLQQQQQQQQQSRKSSTAKMEEAEKCLYEKLQQETDLLDLKMEKEEWRAEKFALQTEVDREIEVIARLRDEHKKMGIQNGEILGQEAVVRSELETWRTQFLSLEANVAPFREQLDKYHMERETLLQEKALTQKDLEKLAEEHAMHMGHQNHKQKIHYLVRVKEENVNLKLQNQKLELELRRLRGSMMNSNSDTPSSRKHSGSEASSRKLSGSDYPSTLSRKPSFTCSSSSLASHNQPSNPPPLHIFENSPRKSAVSSLNGVFVGGGGEMSGGGPSVDIHHPPQSPVRTTSLSSSSTPCPPSPPPEKPSRTASLTFPSGLPNRSPSKKFGASSSSSSSAVTAPTAAAAAAASSQQQQQSESRPTSPLKKTSFDPRKLFQSKKEAYK